MDRNGVIGAGGKLPWRLPADLRHFKSVTMGKPIVMGRRTHESIGRVLPGRENIMLTRDRDYSAPGCTVLHDLNAVFEHCAGAGEIMIMGGADLYRQMLLRAARIYLTQVHAEFKGDTFFPILDLSNWIEREREEHTADESN
ncbi:MAG: dihydrofolate reductase, partial [Gammaproteobacteria bacterium]